MNYAVRFVIHNVTDSGKNRVVLVEMSTCEPKTFLPKRTLCHDCCRFVQIDHWKKIKRFGVFLSGEHNFYTRNNSSARGLAIF